MLILVLAICAFAGIGAASTLGAAIDAALPGSTITIDPGTTWNEHSIIINKPLYLIGDGVTINCLYEGGAFRILSTSGVTIKGFTIINTPTTRSNDARRTHNDPDDPAGDGTVTLSPAIDVAHSRDITIQDVTIRSPHTGILAYNSHNGIITGCIVRNAESEGIRIESGSSGWSISQNTIESSGTGIKTFGSFSSPVSGIKIHSNSILESATSGIVVSGVASASDIRYNNVENTGSSGLHVDHTTTTGTIRDNAFESSGTTHIEVPKTGFIFSSFDIKDNDMKDAPGGPIKGLFTFFGWGVMQYDR